MNAKIEEAPKLDVGEEPKKFIRQIYGLANALPFTELILQDPTYMLLMSATLS